MLPKIVAILKISVIFAPELNTVIHYHKENSCISNSDFESVLG